MNKYTKTRETVATYFYLCRLSKWLESSIQQQNSNLIYNDKCNKKRLLTPKTSECLGIVLKSGKGIRGHIINA
uniref:Uncharacterized protein n=1 Tax=Romanomermis culicivorax TaxID=13658 RepID=A0A915JEU9_ROMCU